MGCVGGRDVAGLPRLHHLLHVFGKCEYCGVAEGELMSAASACDVGPPALVGSVLPAKVDDVLVEAELWVVDDVVERVSWCHSLLVVCIIEVRIKKRVRGFPLPFARVYSRTL